jgi:hypothetical protein
MSRRYVVGIGVVIGVMSGCSQSPYQLPDRNTPAALAEEKRLAALLPDELHRLADAVLREPDRFRP